MLLLVANCAIAQVKHTVTKSTITFQIKNLGFNTRGSFSGLHGDIQFDPANLGSSSIASSVDVSTLNTDNNMRDEHLKSDSYFDATKYPQITMRSVSLKHKNGDNYTGVFNLTIKGKALPVDVPFTYTATGNVALFKGSFKIKRTDFGIGGSSLSMSNDVTVNVDVETSK